MHVYNEYVSIYQLIHATVEYFNASIHADMSIVQSMIGAVVYKLYSDQSHPTTGVGEGESLPAQLIDRTTTNPPVVVVFMQAWMNAKEIKGLESRQRAIVKLMVRNGGEVFFTVGYHKMVPRC
jgi:hypothetical protein